MTLAVNAKMRIELPRPSQVARFAPIKLGEPKELPHSKPDINKDPELPNPGKHGLAWAS
jgi:hypothetical protein